MRAGDRVGVAVSGGADSVALLRLLLDIRNELGVVLTAVHFNHKLRGDESEADEQFVRDLAAEHDLEFFCESADTRAYAAERKYGIEAAARELRYKFFWSLMDGGPRTPKAGERGAPTAKLFRIATAHTMDDQAETVLMRFLRGAGTRGLSGIHPFFGEAVRTELNSWEGPGLVRPLLEFRRAQLRHYLRRASQPWREDSSNDDPAFTRNKLRHELMPKVREFNPAIEQVLSETAEIARAEEDYWSEQVGKALIECRPAPRKFPPSTNGGRKDGAIDTTNKSALDIVALMAYPLALQRRMVRALAEREGIRLEFHHVQQVMEIAAPPPTRAEKIVELPAGWEACVRGRELSIRTACPTLQGEYELPLRIPGEIEVRPARLMISARLVKGSQGDVLQQSLVQDLRVRNWRPGDRYHPAHTASPKKVKELLQNRTIPADARAHWPVVVARVDGSDTVVWVPGFPMSEIFRETEPDKHGLLLEHWVRA